MSKEQNVIEFYVLCNKLKNTLRTGWLAWHVKRERVESIAEHIYGTQMLAIAMWSEYKYNIDIRKVLFMLAIHELEEVLIGDLTPFDATKEEKAAKGHQAVAEILKNLSRKDDIERLILEFDERKTPEALFANHCDKLECDIQCKLYDLENCVDLNSPEIEKVKKIESVNKLLQNSSSWSQAWINFDKNKNNYDANFSQVIQYILDNDIRVK